MSTSNISEDMLKQAVKEALTETLRAQRDLLHEILSEVLEDKQRTHAIQEGRKTPDADPIEVNNMFADV